MPEKERQPKENKMCRQPIIRHAKEEFVPLVTPKEAGAFLRIHEKTAVRMARRREIPALRVRHQWRFRACDLLDWADSQVESSRQPVE